MALDIGDGLDLINKAYEKLAEERAFLLYSTKYAYMDKETFISFDQFLKPMKERRQEKSIPEILGEVKEILDSIKGGDKHGNI